MSVCINSALCLLVHECFVPCHYVSWSRDHKTGGAATQVHGQKKGVLQGGGGVAAMQKKRLFKGQ